MIVAYDYVRGEPRGKFKKTPSPLINTGDCIDCFQCVKVCPTGDIRNGTQMECVGCTACIDACDSMMTAVGKPKGLVRYASENGIAQGAKLRFTGRMKFYSVLLIILASLLSFMLITRKNVDGTIVRAPGMLYQERGTDSISNLYVIKIVNKTIRDIPVELRIENAPGRIIEAQGQDIIVKKEGQGQASFFIILPKSFINERKTTIKVGLYEAGEQINILQTNFMGPFSKFKN